MHWLVDGYNVIRRDPELSSRERESLQAGREALLRLLAPVARRTGDRFTVVFDGSGAGFPPASNLGAVQAVFSRRGESADQLLARLAARAGGGTSVVSSDREVRQAAARADAIPVTAEDFLSRLARRSTPTGGHGKDEDEEAPSRPRKGNPRRPKKRERQARRALDRLGPGP
jgi:predicted RNA-binding protein with PIN domain